MPVFQARLKCPQGVFLPVRMKRYKGISKKIMVLLKEFSPVVEPVSIDEAYMDVGGCERLYGSVEVMANTIKKTIMEKIQLSCSIGVAPNRFLAKVASDMDKPDGLTIIMPEDAMVFCEMLPIKKVPGVGRKMMKQLEKLGVQKLGDIRKFSEEALIKRLGKYGKRLWDLSFCMDETPVGVCEMPKSISRETTLLENTRDKILLNRCLLKQSDYVGRELRRTGLKAKTVSIKIKHDDFSRVTRQTRLTAPTQSSKIIYREAVKLLKKYHLKKRVRLIGVGSSAFDTDGCPVQMDIFEKEKMPEKNWDRIDQTVDSIKAKFGRNSITLAAIKDK